MSATFDGEDADSQVQEDPVGRLRLDFTEFFTAGNPRWIWYALGRLARREDAEDAVQNAGMTMYAKWPQILHLRDPQEVHAYTMKIVKDAVVDQLRSRQRQEARALAASREPAPQQPDSTEAVADSAELRWAMEELRKLAPTYADVVRLRQQDLPYPEVAAQLGIAPGTAKTYYSMGLRYLQNVLDRAKNSHDRDQD